MTVPLGRLGSRLTERLCGWEPCFRQESQESQQKISTSTPSVDLTQCRATLLRFMSFLRFLPKSAVRLHGSDGELTRSTETRRSRMTPLPEMTGCS